MFFFSHQSLFAEHTALFFRGVFQNIKICLKISQDVNCVVLIFPTSLFFGEYAPCFFRRIFHNIKIYLTIGEDVCYGDLRNEYLLFTIFSELIS